MIAGYTTSHTSSSQFDLGRYFVWAVRTCIQTKSERAARNMHAYNGRVHVKGVLKETEKGFFTTLPKSIQYDAITHYSL